MSNELRQHWLGLIGLLAFSLIVCGLFRAGSSKVAAHSSAMAKPEIAQGEQRLYAAIYTHQPSGSIILKTIRSLVG